jgi:exonuclease VII small subunit
MPSPITLDDLQKTARDSFYVTVGLGVIAFQKAQVQRQDLRKQLEESVGGAQQGVSDSVKTIEERLEAVETRIDGVLDDVEEKLPPQARLVLSQARGVAKDARQQLRLLVDRP